jgi:hypothetical protein
MVNLAKGDAWLCVAHPPMPLCNDAGRAREEHYDLDEQSQSISRKDNRLSAEANELAFLFEC